MEKLEIKGTDQVVLHDKLKNGLEVFLLPYEYKSNYFVNYYTNFGSIYLDFMTANNEKISVPAGVAHFLEHKMFEQEEGEGPFEFYSKTGTGCNASTSYKSTKYIIYGNNSIEENLEYLINCINSPYFTDENVNKEKGIIIEEVKMYDDDPEWLLNEELQKSIFSKHPYRIDIGGTCESVNSITRSDLQNCYDNFYIPSNMGLFIGGKFDPNKVMDIILKNTKLNNSILSQPAALIDYEEPYEIIEKKKIINTNLVVNPKIGIGIKLKLNNNDAFTYNLYVGMILSILFGSSSEFREKVLKDKLMTNMAFERFIVDRYLIIEFWVQSMNPEGFVEEFFNYFKNKMITKEETERYKKVWISSEVIMTDNVEVTENNMIDDIIDYGKISLDRIDRIRDINYEKLCEIRNNIDLDNHAIVILKPSK